MRSAMTHALLLLAVLLPPAADCAQPQKFLVFDYRLSPGWIKAHGAEYVFVWGAADRTLEDYVAASPTPLLSTYFPFARDPEKKAEGDWLARHPSWIAYRCDQRSIAYQFGDANLPLDIANPAVVRWQIGKFLAAPALTRAIALDNFQTRNFAQICGVRRGGRFVQRYLPASDKKYRAAMVLWLEQVSGALHRAGRKLVINYDVDLDADSPLFKRILAAVDGITMELSSPPLTPDRYAAARAITQGNKALYLILELEHPSAVAVETAVASYLMVAEPTTAVYVSGIQEYGGEPQFRGFDRPVGDGCGSYRQLATGILVRYYSRGMALFAPSASAAAKPAGPTPLPSLSIPDGYQTLSGEPVERVSMAPGQGRILYRQDAAGCSVPSGGV